MAKDCQHLSVIIAESALSMDPGHTHGRFPEKGFMPAASRPLPPTCAGPGYGFGAGIRLFELGSSLARVRINVASARQLTWDALG